MSKYFELSLNTTAENSYNGYLEGILCDDAISETLPTQWLLTSDKSDETNHLQGPKATNFGERARIVPLA
jgi:hypothetical protein